MCVCVCFCFGWKGTRKQELKQSLSNVRIKQTEKKSRAVHSTQIKAIRMKLKQQAYARTHKPKIDLRK